MLTYILMWAGWVWALNGADLPLEARCLVEDGLVTECRAYASACPVEGCGTELTALTDAIEAWQDAYTYPDGARADNRHHAPPIELTIVGRVPLNFTDPWVINTDRLHIEADSFTVKSGEVPVDLLPGRSIVPGERFVLGPCSEYADGDILFVVDDPTWSTLTVCTKGGQVVAWPWDGPASGDLAVSRGAAIVLRGDEIGTGLASLYLNSKHAQPPARQYPVSAIRALGVNNHVGFSPASLRHPGDCGMLNGRKPEKGIGPAIFTGPALYNPPWDSVRFRGGAYCNVGGVMRIRSEVYGGGGARVVLAAGNTHHIEVESFISEGVGQYFWAPQGCMDCNLGDTLPEMMAPAPFDLPFIDVGPGGSHGSTIRLGLGHTFGHYANPHRTFFKVTQMPKPAGESSGPTVILGGGSIWAFGRAIEGDVVGGENIVCLHCLPPPAPEISCGDVNGDGATDVADLTLYSEFLGGQILELPVPEACDVNADGACNGTDRIIFDLHLQGLRPGLNCGGTP